MQFFLRFSLVFLFLAVSRHVESASFPDPQNGQSFFLYEDASGKLSLSDISSAKYAGKFDLLPINSVGKEITHTTLWIRFRPAEGIDIQQYLELTSPNLHYVTYYQPLGVDQYKIYKTGFLLPYHTRPIPTDRFAFPVASLNEWHYIQIRSEHFMNTGFKISGLQEMVDSASRRDIFYSLYGGLMVLIMSVALSYTVLIRYYSYLFYILYIIFISSINLTEKGFYFQFLWPDAPAINYAFPVLPFGVSACVSLFLRTIWTDTRIILWLFRFNLFGVTLIPFCVMLFFLFSKDYSSAIIITQIHSITSCFLFIVTSIASYISGGKDEKLYMRLIISGLCIFSLGVITYLLAQNHVLKQGVFTENAIIIGSTLEVCFFTVALLLKADIIYKSQRKSQKPEPGTIDARLSD